MIAFGVASSPVPQARFSPMRQLAGAREVAGGADALGGLGAVAARVGEVGVLDHVVAVVERGALEAVVGAQRGEAAVGALAVEQAERRLGDGGEVGRRRAAASALAQASPAPTPSRRFGARRRAAGSIGPPGDSSRRPPPLVSVIASPRRPSVTPRLRRRPAAPGRGGHRARLGALVEPQPASPRLATASRAGISAMRVEAYLSYRAERAQNLRNVGRPFSRRRRPARRARRGRRGR